jgi:hypothetical protein
LENQSAIFDCTLRPEGSDLTAAMSAVTAGGSHDIDALSYSSPVVAMLVRTGGWDGMFATTIAKCWISMMKALPLNARIDIPGFGLMQLKVKDLSPQGRSVLEALTEGELAEDVA